MLMFGSFAQKLDGEEISIDDNSSIQTTQSLARTVG
jgi:hypothetical protein